MKIRIYTSGGCWVDGTIEDGAIDCGLSREVLDLIEKAIVENKNTVRRGDIWLGWYVGEVLPMPYPFTVGGVPDEDGYYRININSLLQGQ